jgi:hypothetical protein
VTSKRGKSAAEVRIECRSSRLAPAYPLSTFLSGLWRLRRELLSQKFCLARFRFEQLQQGAASAGGFCDSAIAVESQAAFANCVIEQV